MSLVRTEPRCWEGEEIAAVREAVLGKRLAQDFQGLQENLDVSGPVVGIRCGIAVACLTTLGAAAAADLEPPTGELIEQR